MNQFGQYIPNPIPAPPSLPTFEKSPKPSSLHSLRNKKTILSSIPQPKLLPKSGVIEGNSVSFHINSKVFSLAFNERQGNFHGSIQVGRSGQWDFSKQHFFKRLHEKSKILEFTSRLNKGGMFVEISVYHNEERRSFLRAQEGVNKGGCTLLEVKLLELFLG